MVRHERNDKNWKTHVRRWLYRLTLFLGLVSLSGCVTPRITEPKRTATEQLLISTATDRALQELELTPLEDRKVYLDTSFLDTYDQQYVEAALRDLMFSRGVHLVPDRNKANVVVEARSGALSADGFESLTGIPAFDIPMPFSTSLKTPELPFYKTQSQKSVAKLVLLAYNINSREHLFSTGALIGKAYYSHYQVLGVGFNNTDLPAKNIQKNTHQYPILNETGSPQQDSPGVTETSSDSTSHEKP